jgi:dienelactone hydrolase
MRITLLLSALVVSQSLASDPSRVFDPPRKPSDSRLTPWHLDRPFPFTANYETKEAWEKRAKELRTQVLVSLGLWPMPEKTPLNAVIHGKIDREDYTIEKVYFASMPGHYVCGNLYRPKNAKGKIPVVLNPHGHWANGRFTEESPAKIKADVASGGEKTEAGAKVPLQAAAVGLCRLGCVVFHYDMVGNADSTVIPHRQGFNSVECELRLQSFLGLQTWNSIRALDFVCTLPDVDTTRIGVTGASGGGTQTFLLCAIDPRPTVAFPAVMVSAKMQGGCICENASLLRVGTNNVELTALFAPKPVAMTGANDWTKEIETLGLPELKRIYGLYGVADKVAAKYFPFPHNYNQVSREMLYSWFNKHLGLNNSEPIVERPFTPTPPQELSVFDKDHPRPSDFVPAERLRQLWADATDRQVESLRQKDPERFRDLQRTALRMMCCTSLPDKGTTKATQLSVEQREGYLIWRGTQTRNNTGEEVPLVAIVPDPSQRTGVAVVWADLRGKAALFTEDGKLIAPVQKLVDQGAAVICADLFLTGEWHVRGEKPTSVPMQPQPHHKDVPFLGYWLGYNRSVPAQRVHDLLSVIGHLPNRKDVKEVWLVGVGDAGPLAGMAAILAGKMVTRVAVDLRDFRFDRVTRVDDPLLLPGGLKYFRSGDLAGLCSPATRLVARSTTSKPDDPAVVIGMIEELLR